MSRVMLFLICTAAVSGCIKLQLPDDLISDTVQAIKGSDTDEPAQDGAEGVTTFSHSIVGTADSPESELKKSCLTELKSRTAELLGTENTVYTVVTENVSITGDKAIASCTVSIE